MTRKFLLLILFGLSTMLFTNSLFSQNDGLQFIENKGQFHTNVEYKAQLPGGAVFLENNRWTFHFIQRPDRHNHGKAHNHEHDHNHKHNDASLETKAHAYRMNFMGANSNPKMRSSKMAETYHNYFRGSDPSKWAGNVRLFGNVFYEDLYECIDLDIYSKGSSLKYDFIVHPDGVASDIVIDYEGVERISLKDGKLIVKTSINEITELKPYAYQMVRGKEKKVRCEFVLEGTQLRFHFPKGYNNDLALIIDPELVFGSYTGSTADNWGYTATYDDEGHLYGGGIVFDTGYPTTIGAFDNTYFEGNPSSNADCDIGLTKFSPDGSSLIYSTYIGGNDTELPHSLIVNSLNQLVLFGTSGSSNYPTTSGTYDSNFNGGKKVSLALEVPQFGNGSDIIVSIFSPTGESLNGSTYFGGSGNDGINGDPKGLENILEGDKLEYNYGDHARGEVFVDEQDNIYIGSCTKSTNLGGGGTIQPFNAGKQDGVIVKFNPTASNLLWYTYVGGSEHDAVYSLKTDESGNIFACGGTEGAGFWNNMNGLNIFYKGGRSDGFVIKISGDGQNALAGSYIGTNSYDQTYFIEIDDFGDIYLLGQTRGTYPFTAGVYSIPGTSQFIHKLNPNLNVTEWATTFGSGNKINISPTAFLVDICGRIYVSGWGGGANSNFNPSAGNTNGLPTTADAFQSSTDGSDLYFFVLDKDATGLLYASYYGASTFVGGEEHVDGGTSRFDKQGTIYQAVCAGCNGGDDFPTTPGAWSNNNGSNDCNLGVIKFNFEPNLVIADVTSFPNPTLGVIYGCAPYPVQFVNQNTTGEEYFWDFGDGATSDEATPLHVYGTIDTFLVKYFIVDSTSCNLIDSQELNVIILDSAEIIVAEYTFDLPEPCAPNPYIVNFNNLSVFDGPLEDYGITWDLGNGDQIFDSYDISYQYPTHGIYNTSLTIIGQPPCSVIETYELVVNIPEDPYVFADFTAPGQGCIPFPSVFEALDDAETYEWDMGDGTILNGPLVEYVYEEAGTYQIILTATDTSTCNDIDIDTLEFNVFESPIADFVFEQTEPYILVPIAFENQSDPEEGMIYHWDFGDGETSDQRHPIHSYLLTGDIEVCLTVTNPVGNCEDTECKPIFISDEFDFNVPNAFSPNGDGVNDSYSISGFGIEQYELLIFNRWGQKVYESGDNKASWDGTFNGKEQPLGVFVYYLSGRVAGGVDYFEKGNITLLR